MTKSPKMSLDLKCELDEDRIGMSYTNRKNNYKSQKPILEKRRRDRINNSLDELKSLLLAIKQRDPLRYARLEKADILEMVVKHLKDVKKQRQALVVAMEPILYRNFKMGYMDCTKATIDFINEIETPEKTKKQKIIEHVTQQCMKTFDSQIPPPSFNEHFQTSLGNMNPLSHNSPLVLSTFDRDLEWPSIEERLGLTSIGNSTLFCPGFTPISDLNSISIPFKKNENSVLNSSLIAAGSAQTSSTFAGMDETLEKSEILDKDTSESDNDDNRIIIDDFNNNQTAWRPWL